MKFPSLLIFSTMYQFCLGIFTYDTLTLNSYVFSFILAFILKLKKKKKLP